jgi:hypothetical protein
MIQFRLVGILAVTVMAHAQETRGTIYGRILDPQRIAVSAATVHVD